MSPSTINAELEITLEHYLDIPLDEAKRELEGKIKKLDTPATIKLPPNLKREHWLRYKDLLSYLITKTSPDIKLVSDDVAYELCWIATDGRISGDPTDGYFLNYE